MKYDGINGVGCLILIYECQPESEPRARLILSHLCSFESEPFNSLLLNGQAGRSFRSCRVHMT